MKIELDKKKFYTIAIGFTIGSFIISLGPKPGQIVMELSIFYLKAATIFFGIGYVLKDEEKS